MARGTQYSSIPSKFQTRLILNPEKKGFNCQAKRFQDIENENPGPGFYNVSHPSTLHSNVSQSQKGTCFFPSLELRIARQRIPSYPAANAYNLPPTLKSKHDFSLGCSSMFQLPIARKVSKRATPAPNQYNVAIDSCKQNYGSGAKSVFCSRTRRAVSFGAKERGPSPCHYRVNDTFVREAPTVLVSCFKSRTSRETKTDTLSPGPAAYQHPDSPVASPRKFRGPRRYGLNFSAPPIPRPETPPSPGPGQYEIVDYKGPPKHYISSAVFVSNTSRWASDKFHKEIPGPGAYTLPTSQKQSFMYNSSNKWMPVL